MEAKSAKDRVGELKEDYKRERGRVRGKVEGTKNRKRCYGVKGAAGMVAKEWVRDGARESVAMVVSEREEGREGGKRQVSGTGRQGRPDLTWGVGGWGWSGGGSREGGGREGEA